MLVRIVIFIVVVVDISSATTLQGNSSSRLLLFQKCVETKASPSKTELVITRTSNPPLYAKVNHQWNLRIHIDPLAYFLPRTTKDVQIAVVCASKTKIRVIPKSGGHSYESYSFGNPDTLVIDFFFMRELIVDQKKGEAQIQPGALLSEVYYKLWWNGKFGLPVGSCLQLGIGGFALGGGQGPFSNLCGYTVDHIIEMEMVDSNGFVHKVNANKNPNLFWALRGIGSGYIGIVTSFKFKLIKAANLHMFNVKIHYDLKYSTDVLDSYQRWLEWTAKNAPTVFSEVWFVGKIRGEFSHVEHEINVDIVDTREKTLPGSQQRRELLMQNIKRIFPPTGEFNVHTFETLLEYISAIGYAPVMSNKTVDEMGLQNVHRENSAQRWVKQRTYFVKKSVGRNVLENMGKLLQIIPNRNVFVELQSDGGAIHNASSNAMSYVHRNAIYSVIIRYEGDPDKNEVAKGWSWIEQYVQAAQPTDSGETYQNYVDTDLKDFLQRYYGQNLPRLIQTKRMWDPTDYFKNPQSIPIR